MARLNTPARRERVTTHEGARTVRVRPEEQLRRSVLSCLLWEDTFYEGGRDIATRIRETAKECSSEFISALAKEARNDYRLRHAPLWLVLELVRRGGRIAGETLTDIIQRPDEITEFLAMYWKDGRRMLPRQVRIGLGNAFNKFDEYQFAKYNRDGVVRLRDALFMSHPKPKDDAQQALFDKITNNTLAVPDTWETRLSAGGDKKAVWEDLLRRNKHGYMALLRNLRGMTEAGVDAALIRERLLDGAAKSKALPFRYIAAAIHAPRFENTLDVAMRSAIGALPPFKGSTVVLVDTSASMNSPVSGKSEMSRIDAACGLAIYAREASDDCRVFAFGTTCEEVPARRGMALRDAIKHADVGWSTNTFAAIGFVHKQTGGYTRLLVITDEQAHGGRSYQGRELKRCPTALGFGYIMNVAAYENGIGYDAGFVHIHGWSEQSIRFIQEMEVARTDVG